MERLSALCFTHGGGGEGSGEGHELCSESEGHPKEGCEFYFFPDYLRNSYSL